MLLKFLFLFFGLVLTVPALGAEPVVPIARDSVQKWCSEVQSAVKKMGWKVQVCGDSRWQVGGTSVEGRPLMYAEYGDPKAQNVTLIFALVHGDENTPLYLGLKLSHWLKENEKALTGTHVILAPMVNPDGFFHLPRKQRMNARGVDINRNFKTADWQASALRSWAIKYRKDPRRYPGNEPRSEPETIFQEDLIKKFKPQKIISIHSPLNFLDYDGPSAASLTLEKFPKQYVQQCLKLRKSVRAITSGFFPGSLGNFAGQEMGIPTLTLELPTADPRKAEAYWRKFSQGIRKAIEFKMDSHASSGM